MKVSVGVIKESHVLRLSIIISFDYFNPNYDVRLFVDTRPKRTDFWICLVYYFSAEAIYVQT